MSSNRAMRSNRNAAVATRTIAVAVPSPGSPSSTASRKRKHEDHANSLDIGLDDDDDGIAISSQAVDVPEESVLPDDESANKLRTYSLRNSNRSVSNPTNEGDNKVPLIHKCLFCEYSSKNRCHYVRHVSSCIDRSEAARHRYAHRHQVGSNDPPVSSTAAATAMPSVTQRTAKSSKSTSRPSTSTSSKKHKTSGRMKSAAGIDLSTGVVHTRSFPLSADRLMTTVGYVLDPDEISARSGRRVYEVESIRSRRFNEEKLQYEYLIKWLGWPESENTWESCSNTRCPELIQQYHIDDEEFLQTQIDDAMEMCSNDDPVIRFHRDGLCDLTDRSLTISKKEAQAAEEWITKLFNAQLKSISLRDQMDVLEERGFVNFKMRQRGRYDLTIDPQQLPFMKNPPWLSTVKKILGGKAFLKHSGCMMSMPGSETQSWHSDGDHRDEATHLPCWMLNVFVPLIDMTRSLGGTEFCPGSHVLHDEFIRTTPVTPLLKMGQVLLFDYRIRHRGMGNRALTARPVLYFSYAGNENIVDEKNFQKGRYLTLPPPLQSVELTREQRHKERMKRITKQEQHNQEELDEEEEEKEDEKEEEKEEGSKEEKHQDDEESEMTDA